jgi:radical SAM superfamily enzyme with C-terminal helix-hairpin-helix motif
MSWKYSIRYGLNFDLQGSWTRSVEDKGETVVRYTATGNDSALCIQAIDGKVLRGQNILVPKGEDVLVIGQTCHLPARVDALAGNPDWLDKYQPS